MKAFIYKTNQYLLERFPTVWNTRLIWMLLTAFLLHLLFFIIGFFTLSNPKILQEPFIDYIFFENGTVFLSSIISLLLIVIWLIFMFKNNAFKNFYPTSQSKLFGQFLCYLLIIFSCTTFNLSYEYGMKTYIATSYHDDQINKEIEIANDVNMFLSESVSNYTIDKRRFPKPFYELYCEDREKFIDYEKPYINFLDESFQFYTLTTKEVPINNNRAISLESDSIYDNFVFSKTKGATEIYYFKDSVVDYTSFLKSAKPSYYNMSSTFYVSKNDTLDDDFHLFSYNNYQSYDYDNYYNRPEFSIRHQLRNQRNYELLKRNNRLEIKTLIEAFLRFSNHYKIEHNLSAEQWLEMVYHPEDDFEVKHFIRDNPKDDYDYVSPVSLEQTETQKFYEDHLSDFHYDNDALESVFRNIEYVKSSNPFMESIHFSMWFTFILAIIIFMFRITGLKPLLFSIITVGLLTLFVILMTVLLFYAVRGSDNEAIYFMSYFGFFLGSLILAIPIFFIDKVKKLIVAICVNISIFGFALYVFLILAIISMHQNDACDMDIYLHKQSLHCPTVLGSLEENWSFVLFAIALIFIFLYSKVIKKWKSLPEG
ncbi:hypothetical protein [uncultured Psychroserpens sp.]|uniref:hypothetical protein n=1 Tax=uncultured Psychroserpens sp. TaxID=255436 RepID=UPI0026314E43|nr:hypothetical protein [uncultured Psychroserpens sp.]